MYCEHGSVFGLQIVIWALDGQKNSKTNHHGRRPWRLPPLTKLLLLLPPPCVTFIIICHQVGGWTHLQTGKHVCVVILDGFHEKSHHHHREVVAATICRHNAAVCVCMFLLD